MMNDDKYATELLDGLQNGYMTRYERHSIFCEGEWNDLNSCVATPMHMEIKYIKGDATQPIGQGNKIIVHVCNDVGGWGKGFVMAISKRWKQPEIQYRQWAKDGQNFALGEVQFVPVEPTIWIANLIGQHDIKKGKDGSPPVRYEAIRKGLAQVSVFARQINASVHMPRIGCGLAGGTWDQIEPALMDELTAAGVETVVYDFE